MRACTASLSKPLRLTRAACDLGEAIREANLEAQNSLLAQELGDQNERAAASTRAEARCGNARPSCATRSRTRGAGCAKASPACSTPHFQEALDPAVAALSATATRLCLLFLDVDTSRSTTTSTGTPAGAVCYAPGRGAAGGSRERLARPDASLRFVARYGGEEFVVVLPETHLEGAMIKADRIRRLISDLRLRPREMQPLGRVR